jgi:small subunit ribosomal protein S2
MQIPSMVEMLKSGVHFGHQTSKWHPHMGPFIFGSRANTHIINLEKTQQQLEAAANYVRALAAEGKTILFVGTKHQAAPVLEKHAQACAMPYVNARWLGGLITNFQNVIQVPRKLTKLKADRESGELKKYTKKEQLEFDREIERLQGLVGGLENLSRMPDAIFVVDLKEEKTALREANQMNIPVVAMTDTNVDPNKVLHPIPANDDAIKSIDLICGVIAEAINEGRAQAPAQVAPEAAKPAAATAAATVPAEPAAAEAAPAAAEPAAAETKQ